MPKDSRNATLRGSRRHHPTSAKIIQAAAQTPVSRDETSPIAEILSELERRAGVDFSRYRRPTVERRVRGRMLTLGMPSAADYLQLLRSCGKEPGQLIERITIKVSRFYRHPPAFDCLRDHVLPQLAMQRGGAPVRIWSVGTGGGEEAYSLAMLLDEAGIPGIIEASDVDPSACEAGRLGVYPASALSDLPVALTERYLERAGGIHSARFRVRDLLRPRVRFSLYDVTRPGLPPGEGCFDLVVCRNLLIYLLPLTQDCALRHLRSAMSEGGFLCLGEAEWPTPAVTLSLEPLAHRTRVFQAVPGPAAGLRS